jgi:hypothetical protein
MICHRGVDPCCFRHLRSMSIPPWRNHRYCYSLPAEFLSRLWQVCPKPASAPSPGQRLRRQPLSGSFSVSTSKGWSCQVHGLRQIMTNNIGIAETIWPSRKSRNGLYVQNSPKQSNQTPAVYSGLQKVGPSAHLASPAITEPSGMVVSS